MTSFKEWVSVGISFLGAGVRDYAMWHRLMRLTFGPLVEPFAQDIWEWSEGARLLKAYPKKSKRNCWEFWNCGLQKSRAGRPDRRKCPAAIEQRLNGVHGGKNAGRSCWEVSGTLCDGGMSGGYPEKRKICMSCDFYRSVRTSEEPFFIPPGTLAAMIAEPDPPISIPHSDR
ncbi:MAG: two-CW domain-containing protein [Thermodesulfovibrionales bacterium]